MLHGERDLQRKPQLMISGNYPARGALSACARARAWRADAQRQGGKRAGWQEGGAVGGARLASSRSAEGTLDPLRSRPLAAAATRVSIVAVES